MAFDITSPSTWDFNGVIDSMTSLVKLNGSVQGMQGAQKLQAAALDLQLAQTRAQVAQVSAPQQSAWNYGPTLPPLVTPPVVNSMVAKTTDTTTGNTAPAGLSTPLMLGGVAVLLVGGYLMLGRKK